MKRFVILFAVFALASSALVSCAGEVFDTDTDNSRSASPSPTAIECPTAKEIRSRMFAQSLFEVEDTGHEIIVHVDGADRPITWDEFKRATKEIARECRRGEE